MIVRSLVKDNQQIILILPLNGESSHQCFIPTVSPN